ncbi:THAP domain-containing protein 1-like isoform X2 [Pagrus major]|uniref:THAP domain-containing protein 1-like isoform X2 n=1 Tax=Pagrus major TaxID=143350 RepID=UPI003CC8BD76
MVRVCSFPGCFNQMKLSYRRSVTFHKLPAQDPERLQLWLIALRRDINTANVDGLRVCSEHFSPEDFKFSKGRALLKTTAVPTESQLKTEQQDTLETDKPPGQIGDTVSDVVQPGEDSLSKNTPETFTATMEKAPLQHIVDEEAILQLMKNCPMCDRKCRCTKHNRGPYFIVYQSCYFCHYQRKWANQPEALNMNINKAYTAPKRKHRLKEKVCVNAKA